MKKSLFILTLLLSLHVSATVAYPFQALTIAIPGEGSQIESSGLHAARALVGQELAAGHVIHYAERRTGFEGGMKLCVELDHVGTFNRVKDTLESLSVAAVIVKLHKKQCHALENDSDDHGGAPR